MHRQVLVLLADIAVAVGGADRVYFAFRRPNGNPRKDPAC